ncbi:hypothetical protein N0V90_003918 [Kalmusia sp. IMI 367209]|nr:hypothetical protein N0V90_003918 [Kalmusia sp. IMI 367209]
MAAFTATAGSSAAIPIDLTSDTVIDLTLDEDEVQKPVLGQRMLPEIKPRYLSRPGTAFACGSEVRLDDAHSSDYMRLSPSPSLDQVPLGLFRRKRSESPAPTRLSRQGFFEQKAAKKKQKKRQRSESPSPKRNVLARMKVEEEKRKRPKRNESDLVILTKGHKKLTFWKEKYAKELGMDLEKQLIDNAFVLFDKKSFQTVFPYRYMGQLKEKQRIAAFPGKIEVLIQSPSIAVRKAYEEHTVAKQDVSRLVLWSDGSVGGGAMQHRSGFAVAWRRSIAAGWGPWEVAGYQAIDVSLDANDVETLAVIKAMDQAHELASQWPGLLKTVAIYTDSTGALYCAQKPINSLGLQVIRKAYKLRDLGLNISLHWCPSHSRVPGNELADRIAGLARSSAYSHTDELIGSSGDEYDDSEEDLEKD